MGKLLKFANIFCTASIETIESKIVTPWLEFLESNESICNEVDTTVVTSMRGAINELYDTKNVNLFKSVIEDYVEEFLFQAQFIFNELDALHKFPEMKEAINKDIDLIISDALFSGGQDPDLTGGSAQEALENATVDYVGVREQAKSEDVSGRGKKRVLSGYFKAWYEANKQYLIENRKKHYEGNKAKENINSNINQAKVLSLKKHLRLFETVLAELVKQPSSIMVDNLTSTTNKIVQSLKGDRPYGILPILGIYSSRLTPVLRSKTSEAIKNLAEMYSVSSQEFYEAHKGNKDVFNEETVGFIENLKQHGESHSKINKALKVGDTPDPTVSSITTFINGRVVRIKGLISKYKIDDKDLLTRIESSIKEARAIFSAAKRDSRNLPSVPGQVYAIFENILEQIKVFLKDRAGIVLSS